MSDSSRKALAGLVLAVLTMPAYVGTSAATEIKTLGRLKIPPDAAVMSERSWARGCRPPS